MIKILRYWDKDRQINQWNKTGSRIRSAHIKTTDFQRRCRGNSTERRQIMLEQLDLHMQKTELQFIPCTIQELTQNGLAPKCKTQNYKISRRKHRKIGLDNDFLDMSPKVSIKK